jgi:hypothetical protein
MIESFIKTITLISLIASANFALRAEIRPNSLFSDNAVLQRNQRIPVWGAATSGETVTLQFAGQKVSAIAEDGRWRVWLNPLEAGGPFTMTISGDNDFITLTNILVGDVWLASGQSNMQYPLGPSWWAAPMPDWKRNVAGANYPQIRQFFVPMGLSYHQVSDVITFLPELCRRMSRCPLDFCFRLGAAPWRKPGPARTSSRKCQPLPTHCRPSRKLTRFPFPRFWRNGITPTILVLQPSPPGRRRRMTSSLGQP